MKSKADHDFWRHFNELPSRVQRLARKNYALWLANPFHPSLHFKRFEGELWSVLVGDHYRATGYFLTSDVLSGIGLARTRNTTSFDGPNFPCRSSKSKT